MNGRMTADVQDPPPYCLPDTASRILKAVEQLAEDRDRIGISQEAVYWYGIGRIHEAKAATELRTEDTQKLQRQIVGIVFHEEDET